MASQRPLALFFVFFTAILISSSHAYRFNVGGKDGWVSNPSENFSQWSSRLRFLISDTLFFKYNKGTDSVLVVNKDNYDNCNTDNPISKMEDGDSVFTLDRSGPFYFISGKKENCQKGQKLTVVVLSLRRSPPVTPPAAAPTPPTTPVIPSPTTGAPPPVTHPSAAPTPPTTPVIPSPGMAPTPGTMNSPISPSPMASSPSPAMGPGSGYPTASSPSPAIGLGSPTASSPGSSGGAGSPAADSNGAPPPGSYAAAAITPSVLLVSWVSFVLSLGMGSFITIH